MADVFLDREELSVVLGPVERAGALHGSVTVPVPSIRTAAIAVDPFTAIRGIRAPGTGIPGVVALGTWRSRRAGRTFAVAYRGRTALVLELDGQRFDRIVVSCHDARRLCDALSPRGAC